MPKVVIHVYDDESKTEIEERELDLADISQVSDTIDEVVLRDGQSMDAEMKTNEDRSWWHKVVGG